MPKLKLMLVDNNVEQMEKHKLIFASNEKVEVVGCCNDGVSAIALISQTKPDVVLLDIILPQLDGFGVLEYFKNDVSRPKFLVLSAMSNDNYVMKAFSYGADYFMVKPFDQELLLQRIFELAQVQAQVEQIDRSKGERNKSVYRTKSLEEKITNIFITVGIPAHIKGYQFLREGIKMTVENPEIINSITKQLYPSIAQRFETTASKVERAIRHAIEVSWNRGKIENINSLFGIKVYSAHDKPTNGEFIALVADKMLIEGA